MNVVYGENCSITTLHKNDCFFSNPERGVPSCGKKRFSEKRLPLSSHGSEKHAQRGFQLSPETFTFPFVEKSLGNSSWGSFFLIEKRTRSTSSDKVRTYIALSGHTHGLYALYEPCSSFLVRCIMCDPRFSLVSAV